jgi:hypothetical protein
MLGLARLAGLASGWLGPVMSCHGIHLGAFVIENEPTIGSVQCNIMLVVCIPITPLFGTFNCSTQQPPTEKGNQERWAERVSEGGREQ